MKKGQSGGIACARKQQAEALARYMASPNLCGNCKSPILPGVHRKGFIGDARRKKFCDRHCAARFNNFGRQRNPDGKPQGRKQRSCVTCGSPVQGKFKRYCSSMCWPKKKDITLETRGSLQERYSRILPIYSWQASRGRINGHAHKVYFRSNRKRECVECGYTRHIHVCHIRAVSDFPPTATIAEINDIANLVALCPNHHWEYDHGFLTAGEWKRIHKPRHAHDVEIPGSTPAARNQFDEHFYRPERWAA
jgi:hypothetical protein